MRELKYTITDPDGIHARPAGELVKLVKNFKSDISIGKDEKKVDAKRIFGIMGLAIKQGQEITICADGEDEELAIEEIENFLKTSM